MFKIMDVIEKERPDNCAMALHGKEHWYKVNAYGQLLCASYPTAIKEVVRAFAFTHDCMRYNEGDDPGHGGRAAGFIDTHRDQLPHLSDREIKVLQFACTWHTRAVPYESDSLPWRRFSEMERTTIKVCFDADSLDIGRVGVIPDPKYLFTTKGIEVATEQARTARAARILARRMRGDH